jgi:sugar fermentation stimulation protein A
MRLPQPLVKGILTRRYKRFLADVVLDDGRTVTAHCPNPGAMLGLNQPGMTVWLSSSSDPRRKLAFTLELVEADGGLVGINTQHPNRLVAEALSAGAIPELAGYETVRPEVAYGQASRVDFLLTGAVRLDCRLEVKNCSGTDTKAERHWLEVKNSHYCRVPGLAEFPDCAAARSTRPMDELANTVRQGNDATVPWVIQISGIDRFSVCRDIDPVFAAAVDRAQDAGIQMLCYVCEMSTTVVTLGHQVPYCRYRVVA